MSEALYATGNSPFCRSTDPAHEEGNECRPQKGYAEWVGGHGEGTGGMMGMAIAICRRKVESLEPGLPELCAEKREKSDSSLYNRISGRTALCELPPSITNVHTHALLKIVTGSEYGRLFGWWLYHTLVRKPPTFSTHLCHATRS